MDNSIEKVMKLDMDVEEYRISKQMEIKERKEGLKKNIEKAWADVDKELKNLQCEVEEKYKKDLKESQERIEKEKYKKISNIKEKYDNNKETIVEDIFKAILSPFKGE